jgi:hypothetical protein
VERAQVLCKKQLQGLPGNPTLLSVQKQLDFIQKFVHAKRKPTAGERKSIDMGRRMAREFEGGYDVEFGEFKELISILDLYFRLWPTDKLVSDPKNEDKIDWDGNW